MDALNAAAHGPPPSFAVELAQFSGPLDLLLSLIRDERLDIYDIPIAQVCEQFLARVKGMDLDEAADYLEMAARLLRIKAQLLLPRNTQEEHWEDPRAELVRRLLEYQQMREVVGLLERRAEDRRNRFGRSWFPPQAPPPAPPLALNLAELLAAVDRVLRVATRPTMHEMIPRPLDVDGAMTTVRALLALRANATWSDILPRNAEPWQVLSALLALLELARRGELRLAQPRPFASLEISRDTAGEAA